MLSVRSLGRSLSSSSLLLSSSSRRLLHCTTSTHRLFTSRSTTQSTNPSPSSLPPSSRSSEVQSRRCINTQASSSEIEVLQPGMQTLVQDYPGRIGYWRVGVPPSGPMDHFSFRLANRLVGNDEGTAALEIAFSGPQLKFNSSTVVAITGANISAELDGTPVKLHQAITVPEGSVLSLNSIEGGGSRSYLAIAGGIQCEDFLGSKATFPLGNFGGPNNDGKSLKIGDKLKVPKIDASSKKLHQVPTDAIQQFGSHWEIAVTLGPQEAPDYFTEEDIQTIFNSTFEVSHNASRLGVRLIGPKLQFARRDGGAGGTHPSNLLDNAYAIGSINFTGDTPVALTVDGPSLGGFVCPITIPTYELWKFGQVKPNDTIKFKKITIEEAVEGRKRMDHFLQSFHPASPPPQSSSQSSSSSSLSKLPNRALLNVIEATDKTPRVQYRLAGDRYLLVEYGEQVLDINYRVRIHSLEKWILSQKLPGVIDTIPGVRSMLIEYESKSFPLPNLLQALYTAEKELPASEDVVLPSRTVHLPMAFRDRWTRDSIDKYINTIRSEAPYLPDNVEFIARNNGLSSVDQVRDMVFNTNYLTLGLGDVYPGAPCAVPMDPRQRLVVPKYNPARTFTPEGGVGIGGAFMCIYPLESPGGYQLIGRTLQIWNQHNKKPWLLDMWDQVKFHEVSEAELEAQREAYKRGELKVKITDGTFDVKAYNKFLKSVESETKQLQERQAKAQAVEFAKDAEILSRLAAAEEGAEKIVAYLAEMVVNGPDHPGAIGDPPSNALPIIPQPSKDVPAGKAHSDLPPPPGFKQIFDKEGPEGFARAVRKHKGLLITDTTWRDAHQSLLATRVRTRDFANIAKATSHVLHNAYSLECWGGATFDVALRFLHECPWDRLAHLRELVPNIPFQMLLRGASAVGYTNYPDNVVYHFCKLAKRHGMDVFRIFDSLNYVDNLKLGIDAVGQAGGIVEAAISYSGDITNPNKTKYTLDYYLKLARELVKAGIHVLCVKDMAGLLKPTAARILIGALRREFPDIPIHVHTHDTAGTGVASMLACYEAGADAVDCAIDASSGLTSQPAMGALVNDLAYTEHRTGVDPIEMLHLTTYWEGVRRLYAPFETGQKSAGSDVYLNEIPGGQYTNMQFQALSLGLAGEWDNIKRAYAEANEILGDIVKVTPSSKVVGDLAQFMVTNRLDKKATLEQAETLNFPSSVVDYLQGGLGIPPGGFPEPFRTKVLKDLPRIQGRPGASMPPFDFDKLREQLEKEHGKGTIREVDLSSAAQYPAVFKGYKQITKKYGNITNLPTRFFLAPMNVGDQVSFQEGAAKKTYRVKLLGVTPSPSSSDHFSVQFEVNGAPKKIKIKAKKPSLPPFILRNTSKGGAATASNEPAKEKVDKSKPGQVGAPMPGKVLTVHITPGQTVQKGDKVAVLSAMKMETVVTATASGKVTRVLIKPDDSVSPGDLLVEIQA